MRSATCSAARGSFRGSGRAALLLALLAAALPCQAQTVRPKRDASTVSDLLRPPGEPGSYSGPVDWQALPPWQQTSFFGVKAQGQLFVYVVDCSGSMADSNRMIRAKAELKRSIQALRWPQRFLVIFYNDQAIPLGDGVPLSATPAAKGKLESYLSWIAADGETDPRGAMKLGLGIHPDAVFLLTDGEYPEGTSQAIASLNAARKVPIHAIDLSGGENQQLRQIAHDSGGQYASRP